MKNIKEQADSYVEIFKPIIRTHKNVDIDKCIYCAIIHVEGLINVLSSFANVYASIEAYKYIRILEELKSRI